MSKNVSLDVYPGVNGGYIANLVIPSSVNIEPVESATPTKIHTVIILDQSGSMGQSVNRLLTKAFPTFFESLGYKSTEDIHVIFFESDVHVHDYQVSAFPNLTEESCGGTYMAQALTSLESYLSSLDDGSAVRIITVSDGDVYDQEATVAASAGVKAIVDQKALNVNSQAIRLFTSSNQPDTRAVSSVLQLNTVQLPTLLDIDAHVPPPMLLEAVVPLFCDDGLGTRTFISSSNEAWTSAPWTNSAATSTMTFNPSSNTHTLWLSRLPEGEVMINDNIPVSVNVHTELSEEVYKTIMHSKLEFYLTQLKLFRIVNTPTSIENAKKIADYFSALENSIKLDLSATSDIAALERDVSLHARIKLFRQVAKRNNTLFALRMSEIANDESIAKFNSAQSAEYLRSVGSNRKTARGLVRRAGENVNFIDVARDEVRALVANIGSLADIDDSEHQASFCSLSTTLDALRTLSVLLEEECGVCALDSLTVDNILECLNIVGIPANAKVADYPDPFRYNLKSIFPGLYVSLSDVLVATKTGGELIVPGFDEPVTDVIPFFEDPRIQEFYNKHAPQLLSYTSSVGMRRVVADVPQTTVAAVGAGVLKLLQSLHSNKSQVHMKVFMNLLKTFLFTCMPHTQKTELQLIQATPTQGQLAFLGSYSLAQLLLPLVRTIKNDATLTVVDGQLQLPSKLQSVMRSIYVNAVWDLVRRQYKGKEQSDAIVAQLLDDFLGIDRARYGQQVAPLFQADIPVEDVIFHNEQHESAEYHDLVSSIRWLDYIFVLPQYLYALTKGDESYIHSLVNLNDANTLTSHAKVSMGLQCDVETLKRCALFLALEYTTYDVRNTITAPEEPNVGTSNLPDVETSAAVDALLHNRVSELYKAEYERALKEKSVAQVKQIAEDTVDAIASLPLDEACKVWTDGLTKGASSHSISSMNSVGYQELFNVLVDEKRPVADRIEKLRVLVLGVSRQGAPVWNKGSVLFIASLEKISRVFYLDQFNQVELWNEIMLEYRERKKHIYRELPNRHTHHNGKRSYWADGYLSLEDMVSKISTEQWDEYRKVHQECCGITTFLTEGPPKKKQKK